MRASTYNMDIKIILIIVLNLGLSVLEKHTRSFELPTIARDTYPYHLEERIGTLRYIYMEITCYKKLNRVSFSAFMMQILWVLFFAQEQVS